MWEKYIQGHILGSFFYGYLVSQIPGGLLAERYGAKWVIAGSMSLSTMATLLTPVASHVSYIMLIVLRVMCGIGSVCFIFIRLQRIFDTHIRLLFNPFTADPVKALHFAILV